MIVTFFRFVIGITGNFISVSTFYDCAKQMTKIALALKKDNSAQTGACADKLIMFTIPDSIGDGKRVKYFLFVLTLINCREKIKVLNA